MTIQEMIARQQAIVSGAKSAGRGLTDEETREFNELQRSIDAARQAEAGATDGTRSADPAAAQRAIDAARQQAAI